MPSSLVFPSDLRYGELDNWSYFLQLEILAADTHLSSLCKAFLNHEVEEQNAFRLSLTRAHCYTLSTFSARAAALSLKLNEHEWLRDGCIAAAMMRFEQMDFRDAWHAISVLHYVSHEIRADAGHYLETTARIADPDIAAITFQLRDRPGRAGSAYASAFATLHTRRGPALINRGVSRYQPTHDLSAAAEEMAELIHQDSVYSVQVEIARDIPTVWLKSVDNQAMEKAVEDATGGVLVRGTPRVANATGFRDQLLLIWLLEMSTNFEAATLDRITKSKTARPSDTALMGLRCGQLFCLVVARSIVIGAPPTESASSILRFSDGLNDVLRKYGA